MLDTFKIHTCCVKKKDIMHYFLVKCFREVGVFITGSYCNPSYPCCICLLSARLTDMYTMPGSYVFLVSIYCPILPNSGKNNLVLLSKKKKSKGCIFCYQDHVIMFFSQVSAMNYIFADLHTICHRPYSCSSW